MVIAYIPLVLVGLLMFLLCGSQPGATPTSGKLSQLGLWIFIAAFHVTMMTLAHVTTRLG